MKPIAAFLLVMLVAVVLIALLVNTKMHSITLPRAQVIACQEIEGGCITVPRQVLGQFLVQIEQRACARRELSL